MAHPKGKTSKQRKRKRRTHYKTAVPNVSTCSATGAAHLWHRAYWVDDNMYYRGKLVIKADEDFEN